MAVELLEVSYLKPEPGWRAATDIDNDIRESTACMLYGNDVRIVVSECNVVTAIHVSKHLISDGDVTSFVRQVCVDPVGVYH